jgi:NAD+ kinase
MDRIAVTANPNHAPAGNYIPDLLVAMEAAGVAFRLDEDGAASVGRSADGTLREIAEWAEMVLVVGGDGSMLRAVQKMRPLVRPLMGVNSGRLGFLTYSTATDPSGIAAAIRDEDFLVSERSMICGEIQCKGEKIIDVLALNEITVTRHNVARMIRVEASIHSEVRNHYYADGLIVATPTGSTAYSMSAGGPVVAPSSQVMVITPICPHALSNRSVVVADSEVVELRVLPSEEGEPVVVTSDGENAGILPPGCTLKIRRAETTLPLARPRDRSFFETLRLKLRWHGSNV